MWSLLDYFSKNLPQPSQCLYLGNNFSVELCCVYCRVLNFPNIFKRLFRSLEISKCLFCSVFKRTEKTDKSRFLNSRIKKNRKRGEKTNKPGDVQLLSSQSTTFVLGRIPQGTLLKNFRTMQNLEKVTLVLKLNVVSCNCRI